jgi:DeoR family glycerol-3-phosphate regulon repressor
MANLTTRQNAILNQVRQQGRVIVGDLAQAFRTTPQTIRKDLEALAAAHLVVRFHGGASLISGTEYTSFDVRKNIATAQKEAIGLKAAELIPNNVAVMINAGTTTAAVARALKGHVGLKIITDNVSMANSLRKYSGVDVMVPGGAVRGSDGAIVGGAAVEFIRQFYADYAVISAAAMGEAGDLFDFDIRESTVARAIIENSKHIILAADRTKFDRTAPVRVGQLSQVHSFVTDICDNERLKGLCEHHEVDLFEACRPAA